MMNLEEPRFLLEKESVCYGCPHYVHWVDSDDPNYWVGNQDNIDENGGVCDSREPCFAGSLNSYRSR